MAFAPGKILLFGEHAVVHGEPAIAATLASGVSATLRPGTGKLSAPCWDLSTDAAAADRPGRAWKALATAAGADPHAWDVELTSSLPAGAGLGSSAAMSVAIARALAATGGPTTAHNINDCVWAAERVFHGNPSGLDHAVILASQPVIYRRPPSAGGAQVSGAQAAQSPPSSPLPPNMRPIKIGRALPLVVAQIAPGADTSAMVASVQQRLDEQPELIGDVIRKIGALVRQATDVLERGDLNALGGLFNKNHQLLQQLGVSTPALDSACGRALELGSRGAKLTGAGGGGCIIALAESDERAAEIAEGLSTDAMRVLVTSIAANT